MTAFAGVCGVDMGGMLARRKIALVTRNTGLIHNQRVIKYRYQPGDGRVACATWHGGRNMLGGNSRRTHTIMAGLTGRIANKAMIHNCGYGETRRTVAGIAGGGNGNMRRCLAHGQNTVVTCLALCGQHFKDAADMAGLTIDNPVLSLEGEARYQMVKGRDIRHNRRGVRQRHNTK